MAGDTIEQVVVKFIADNTSYLRDIKNMQAEMHKYGVLTSNTLEKIDQKLGKTSKSYKQASTSAQQFHKTGSSGAMSMFQHYTNLGAQLGFLVRQYVSLYAAVRTVTTVMKEGLNFNKFKEETTVAFTVMMRSADAAKAKMEELYDFAVKSPMTFQETAKGARQLMAYGFQAEELVGTMKMLGTVGKAVGASMDDMAYVYGTLRAQGRAYSRDLLQFGMRGIPIYEELAKVMDVNVSKIQKLASEGQIGFKQVEKAFRNMTNEGGRFGGILDAWMQTFAGKSSMLADIWQKNLGAMTEGTLAIFKDIVDRLIIALDTPEAAETFANMGKSIAGLIELLITLVDIFAKFKVLILGMAGIKLLTKTTMSLMTMFTGAAGKLVGMAQGLYAIKGASALATTGITSLSGGINVLSSAMAATSFLPIMGGLALLGAEAFRIVKKVRELKEEFAENMQDPTFSYNQMRANLYNQLLSGPESAGGMIYAKDYTAENIFNKKTVEEKNAKLLTDYQNIIKNYVAKYKVTAIEVVKEMQDMGAITGQLEKMLVWWATKTQALPKAAEKLQDVELPDLAEWLATRTGVDVSAIVDPIKTQIEAINGQEGYEFISSYDVLAKRAASMYVTSFNEGMKTEEGLAKAVGGEWGLDQNIAQVKKRIEEFSTLYMDFSQKIDFAGSASDEFLTEEITKWVAELAKLEKEKKALEEATKAREKYNEEIGKMSDEINKYVELGFNPTKIQEIDYEFKKLTEDIDANKGIWQYITDIEDRNKFIEFMQELNFYRKGQIEETQEFELANAKLSKELEYQLALMEGQAFYANQELAMFDAQLESQKQILQLTIDRGGEGVDAAKQELAWVTKIGEVQRRNLERELALTRARRFLAGEGSEEYWNSVILRLAGKLGMPSYKTGTLNVPDDGPAYLHKGEMVVPANDAQNMRNYIPAPQAYSSIQDAMNALLALVYRDTPVKSLSEFLAKRSRGLEKGTWTTGQKGLGDVVLGFLAGGTKLTDDVSIYSVSRGFLGGANAKTYGAGIGVADDIFKSESPNYLYDIIAHEMGHVLTGDILGSALSSLISPDYMKAYNKAEKADKKFSTFLNDPAIKLAKANGTLPSFSIYQTMREEYEQEWKDYERHPFEQVANFIAGLYGGPSYGKNTDWGKLFGWYAGGTGGAKRGPAIVGERGPELVYMNGGETVIPNHMLNGYVNGAGVPGYNPVDYGNEEMRMAIEEMKRQALSFAEVLALLGEQAMGSEVGRAVSTGGESILGSVISSLGGMLMTLDSVNKILNPFTTILQGMMDVLGPAINDALAPLVQILTSIGNIIGKILLPVVKLVGEAFTWIHDKVFLPIGNALIDVVNWFIEQINKLNRVDIAYLEHLETMEEINKQAERLATGEDALNQTITYLNDKLQEEVDRQIDTYQDLYELGLIDAAEYEKQVADLNALLPKEDELVSLADQQLTKLGDISDRLTELKDLQKTIEKGDLSPSQQITALNDAGITTTPTAPTIPPPPPPPPPPPEPPALTKEGVNARAQAYLNSLKWWEVGKRTEASLIWLKSLPKQDEWLKARGYAVGTPFVPSDMMASIHRGEMIIPQTFSDSIRKGELVLSGGDGMSGGAVYNVTVNVQGSVLKENDLATSISTAIRRGTKRGFVV